MINVNLLPRRPGRRPSREAALRVLGALLVAGCLLWAGLSAHALLSDRQARLHNLRAAVRQYEALLAAEADLRKEEETHKETIEFSEEVRAGQPVAGVFGELLSLTPDDIVLTQIEVREGELVVSGHAAGDRSLRLYVQGLGRASGFAVAALGPVARVDGAVAFSLSLRLKQGGALP